MYKEAASWVSPTAVFLMGFCQDMVVRGLEEMLGLRLLLPKHGLQASKA